MFFFFLLFPSSNVCSANRYRARFHRIYTRKRQEHFPAICSGHRKHIKTFEIKLHFEVDGGAGGGGVVLLLLYFSVACNSLFNIFRFVCDLLANNRKFNSIRFRAEHNFNTLPMRIKFNYIECRTMNSYANNTDAHIRFRSQPVDRIASRILEFYFSKHLSPTHGQACLRARERESESWQNFLYS